MTRLSRNEAVQSVNESAVVLFGFLRGLRRRSLGLEATDTDLIQSRRSRES